MGSLSPRLRWRVFTPQTLVGSSQHREMVTLPAKYSLFAAKGGPPCHTAKSRLEGLEDHREGSAGRKKVTLGKGRLQNISPGNGALQPAGGRAALPSPQCSLTVCMSLRDRSPEPGEPCDHSPPPAVLPVLPEGDTSCRRSSAMPPIHRGTLKKSPRRLVPQFPYGERG